MYPIIIVVVIKSNRSISSRSFSNSYSEVLTQSIDAVIKKAISKIEGGVNGIDEDEEAGHNESNASTTQKDSVPSRTVSFVSHSTSNRPGVTQRSVSHPMLPPPPPMNF